MRSCVLGVFVAAGLLGCFPGSGFASKADLIASSIAVIAAPDESESRLLIKFDLLRLAKEHEVYYADITFHLTGLDALQEMELFEVGDEWSVGTVTWEEPWKTPGGDIRSERRSGWITDERTGDLVKFVVTESVSRFLSGGEWNYGFLILTVGDDSKRLAFPAEAPVLTIYSGPKREREPRK